MVLSLSVVCAGHRTNLLDIIAVPGIIPTVDITQSKRTVTTVVVQWKEPTDYNAPITMYELGNLRTQVRNRRTQVSNLRTIVHLLMIILWILLLMNILMLV